MSAPLDSTFDPTGQPFNLTLTGSLHPHLLLTPRNPLPGCSLQLSITLPDHLFPDPDELRDQWGAETEGLPSLSDGLTPPLPSSSPIWWSLTPRDIDVERPEISPKRGLETSGAYPTPVRLDVALPPGTSLDLPLHFRYLIPMENIHLDDDSQLDGGLMEPTLSGKGMLSTSLRHTLDIFGESVSSGRAIADLRAGWACPGETGTFTFPSRAATPIPYPASSVWGDFPLANTKYRLGVESITAAVIWAGWAWIVFKMWKGRRTGREKRKVE